MTPLARARSFLFVPANRPERFGKALACGADVVIIDLEDAVAPADKPGARTQLAEAYSQLAAADRARLVVRINAIGTLWHNDDLTLLNSAVPGLAGVMIPKAETQAALLGVAQAAGSTCGLLPQIESLAGLDAVNGLAAAPQVVRLAFGNLDFQADLGMACGPDEAELVPVRLALVQASRRANRAPPVDGVTADISNLGQLQGDVARSRRSGFGAKLCIHPSQVAGVNAAFSPDAAELAWAGRVMAAFEAAGGGVVSLDGRMIDAPVVRLAQQTLVRSR